MKIKSRLGKLEHAIEELTMAGQPRFRTFFAGDKPLPPQRGTLDIVFNMPPPKPVPPELREEKQ
jgi:hypothetical protein